MSLLEKIKAFVSNEKLMLEFIDLTNIILKIESCDEGCEFKVFCELLKNCFERNISLNEKQFFLLDNVSHLARFWLFFSCAS